MESIYKCCSTHITFGKLTDCEEISRAELQSVCLRASTGVSRGSCRWWWQAISMLSGSQGRVHRDHLAALFPPFPSLKESVAVCYFCHNGLMEVPLWILGCRRQNLDHLMCVCSSKLPWCMPPDLREAGSGACCWYLPRSLTEKWASAGAQLLWGFCRTWEVSLLLDSC